MNRSILREEKKYHLALMLPQAVQDNLQEVRCIYAVMIDIQACLVIASPSHHSTQII